MKAFFIIFYVLTSSWCQDETVFHCSAKPKRLTFNIDEHSKEYPITCKSNSTVLSWLDLASRNLDITTIRTRLNKLENKFDENIDLSGKGNFENRESRQKIKEQSTKITYLLGETKEQSTEIKKLKKDLVEVQEINSKLLEELDKQKKTNDEMKEAISRIERKLAVTKKPQKRQPGSKQITRPTINTKTTLKPTRSQDNCELKIGNVCYFAVSPGKNGVNYYKAVELCKKRNADVGWIRDEESYNEIMKFLKTKIPKGDPWIRIWTGMHFDPMTRDVTPADSFIKWYPDLPSTGNKYKERTNVHLSVQSNPNDVYQGMWNVQPDWENNGVLCESQT
uniref:uncharacterized protein LOC120325372 n=1 Tax=Styela clava TaxID=7725 RepID=UPI00193A6AFD|nr:uncharacterized protein LOC120325372 [Styela clava]